MGTEDLASPGGETALPHSPPYIMRMRAPVLPLASKWLRSCQADSPQMPRLRPTRLQTTTSRTTEHSTQPTIHLPR